MDSPTAAAYYVRHADLSKWGGAVQLCDKLAAGLELLVNPFHPAPPLDVV
jgi:hypothetical protein